MKSFRGFIVLLLSFFCSIMVYAKKEYDSFLKEGKVWTMSYKATLNPEVYPDLYHYSKMMLHGDTLINEIPFKQIYEKGLTDNLEDESAEWKATRQFVGEKDGRIFYLNGDYSVNPIGVMDFSLNVSDVFDGDKNVDKDVNEYYIVKSVSDTILLCSDDKRPRRCLEIYTKELEGNEYATDTWIEGVGSVIYGMKGLYGLSLTGSTPKLLRCEDNGVCIFSADEQEKNNQTTSMSSPKSIFQYNNTFFNLQGRPVKNAPQHGIYVKDGRKVIR